MYQIQRFPVVPRPAPTHEVLFETACPHLVQRVYLRLIQHRYRQQSEAERELVSTFLLVEPYPDVCLYCGHVPGRNPQCSHERNRL